MSFSECIISNTGGQTMVYSPTCVKQAPKGYSKVLAIDRCLLNTGKFQCICPFLELITHLLNTRCLFNTGDH